MQDTLFDNMVKRYYSRLTYEKFTYMSRAYIFAILRLCRVIQKINPSKSKSLNG